jgi:hypothetical protein
MLDVSKGDTVFNHRNSGRNIECTVTKVTKGFVWCTVKGSNGTVQDKYNKRTGMLVNQAVWENDYITIEKEV